MPKHRVLATRGPIYLSGLDDVPVVNDPFCAIEAHDIDVENDRSGDDIDCGHPSLSRWVRFAYGRHTDPCHFAYVLCVSE